MENEIDTAGAYNSTILGAKLINFCSSKHPFDSFFDKSINGLKKDKFLYSLKSSLLAYMSLLLSVFIMEKFNYYMTLNNTKQNGNFYKLFM